MIFFLKPRGAPIAELGSEPTQLEHEQLETVKGRVELGREFAGGFAGREGGRVRERDLMFVVRHGDEAQDDFVDLLWQHVYLAARVDEDAVQDAHARLVPEEAAVDEAERLERASLSFAVLQGLQRADGPHLGSGVPVLFLREHDLAESMRGRSRAARRLDRRDSELALRRLEATNTKPQARREGLRGEKSRSRDLCISGAEAPQT